MQYPDNVRPETGILYIVATPIGNLSDISGRAAGTLQDVDFIAAEDTRVTRRLTGHLGIRKPLVNYRAHNRHDAGNKILARLLAGESCALVTDAGTPAISDPGDALVRLCASNNVPVVIIPGPCAAIAGLALSGFPAARFVFEGFLPPGKGKRRQALSLLKSEKRTMVFYEAPHRLAGTLADMLEVFGDRGISVSREITKLYEQTLRTDISGALSHFGSVQPRGEFVLVVEGARDMPGGEDNLCKAADMALSLVAGGLTTRDAVKEAARVTGCSKNDLYEKVTSGR